MEIASAEAQDKGKRCHRSRKKPRRPGSTLRGRRRGAPLVDVSGRRRVYGEEIPAEAERGNVVDHVAGVNGLGPPNPAQHEGEDFVCGLLNAFPEPTAQMILPPIPSPAGENHLRAHDQ